MTTGQGGGAEATGPNQVSADQVSAGQVSADEVRAVLGRYGITPSDDELAALSGAFTQTRAASALLDTVETAGVGPASTLSIPRPPA